jgi:hypothetical protein
MQRNELRKRVGKRKKDMDRLRGEGCRGWRERKGNRR